MERIAFFIPYFGRFNSYFPLWIKTCSHQRQIADFYIFTDIKYAKELPENVKLIHITFEALRQKIQVLYDFKIDLSSYYKFCDLKPAYGEIFRAYAEGYSHWAFGDNDLLWGDWQNMLPNNWSECDRLGEFGHLTIIKNTERMRTLYKYRNAYKIAFSSTYNCFFDERAFNAICKHNQVEIVPLPIVDCDPRKRKIYLQDKTLDHKSGVFSYENGHLYQIYKDKSNFSKEEFLYIHFLKRKMDYKDENAETDTFVIYDHSILAQPRFSLKEFEHYSQDKFYWSYWFKYLNPQTLFRSIAYRMNKERKAVMRSIDRAINSRPHTL